MNENLLVCSPLHHVWMLQRARAISDTDMNIFQLCAIHILFLFFTTLSRAFFFFLFFLDSFFTLFFFISQRRGMYHYTIFEGKLHSSCRPGASTQHKSSPIQCGSYARAADTNRCVLRVRGSSSSSQSTTKTNFSPLSSPSEEMILGRREEGDSMGRSCVCSQASIAWQCWVRFFASSFLSGRKRGGKKAHDDEWDLFTLIYTLLTIYCVPACCWLHSTLNWRDFNCQMDATGPPCEEWWNALAWNLCCIAISYKDSRLR